MGLDSYLYKKSYVRNGDYYKPEHRMEVEVKTGGEVSKTIKPERIKYVVEEVAYWRKANQIHNWFVQNVQGEVDNCQSSYVNRDNLEELLDLCKQVQADNELADSLLPTRSGFFFGGTEYDEWYFKDIQNTITFLEDCLSDELADEFEYSASW
jgi:uncharacterized protein YneR